MAGVDSTRSRRRGSRKGANGLDARQAILEAASGLLSDRPLDDLTVVDIIEAAGVSRASFYLYFESKHDAVAALAATVIERVYDELWSGWFERSEAVTHETYVRHVRETLEVWNEHRGVLSAAAQGWRSRPDVYAAWGDIWKRMGEHTRAYIERVRAKGRAPDHPDADLLAQALLWTNENLIFMSFTGEAPELTDPEALAEAIAAIWWRTIHAVAPAANDR